MSEAAHANSRDRLVEEAARLAQRYPGLTSDTAARSTLRWFEQKVAVEQATIDEDWSDVRMRMRAANAPRSVTRIVTIDNDFWICKRANPDLACFAIDAMLPLYPRPVVAVSHRGADAKAPLAAGTAWGANEVILDATFRPHWQTNRAMVWSLFASTPVLCRIRSA